MAANLATAANGSAMVAYRGETPWHKQGTKVADDCTGPEMLKASGLDFEVQSVPVVAKGQQDISIPDMKATVRMDTNTVLGIVGKDYNIFQNSEMIEFFESLVQGKKIQYEVAGGLGDGGRVWVLARIPDLSYAIKGDEMVSYMAIRNSHDGSMNLCVHPTNTRIVCANTYKAASSEFIERRKLYGKSIHAGYKIRHTKGMRGAVEQAINAYEKCLTDAEKTRQLYEILAEKPVTEKELRAYFVKMMETADRAETEEKEKASKLAEIRREKKLNDLMGLWNSPTNQTGTRGTVLAAYNTLVEYVDFKRQTRCVDGINEDSARFESAMFGSGDNLKSAGLVAAMDLAGV